MSKMMYVARWHYGPSLTRVQLIKETPKTFTAQKGEELIGWNNFGRRANKNKHHLFGTMAEALAWLLERARKDYHQQQEAALKACARVADLELALEAALEHDK